MATASSSSSSSSVVFRRLSSPSAYTSRIRHHGFFVPIPKPSPILPRGPFTLSIVASARRRNSNPSIPSKKKMQNKKKEIVPQNDDAEEEGFDEDAIEALFQQLEEDLKNDPDLASDEGDDEISEEDLARLEQELEEAFGSSNELSGTFHSNAENTSSSIDAEEDENANEDEDENGDDDEDEDEVERPKLKNWQMRRLACALKIGRRKTSIKSLAAELCLDRAVVLEMLRDPPPNLLLLSAALPDNTTPTASEPETNFMEPESKPVESSMESTEDDVVEPEPKVKLPVHVRQSRWSMQKRLKKVQIETLERVYLRSKRPTNAMISSIVHVTNLPRKRVVQWFEEKRAEDGVPLHRVPYQRSTPETMLTN